MLWQRLDFRRAAAASGVNPELEAMGTFDGVEDGNGESEIVMQRLLRV
jgi:hypothetical protein